jgi:hypothetical protein
MGTREYETLYGVGLLDDLHNYFPAILYEPEQFRTVAHILTYLQRQTHRRFDLFTFGQTAYNERRPAAAQVQPRPVPAQHPVVSVNLGAALPRIPAAHPTLASLLQEAIGTQEDDEEEEEASTELRQMAELLTSGGRVITTSQNQAQTTLTLLSALLGLRNPAQQSFPAEFLNPVVVRPSQEQIDTATTTCILEDTSSQNCAICQDSIVAHSEQREITYCHHAFHRGCIDTWFQQNVHCPVCRHDIRERGELNPLV